MDLGLANVYAIIAEGLVKRYRDVTALRGLNLRVKWGEIHGLLGPNGAGKTTTLKIIVGLLRMDSGSVWIAGRNIKSDTHSYKTLIGYLPEIPGLPEYLMVKEFLGYIARLRGIPKEEVLSRVRWVSSMFELDEVLNNFIYTLSRGYKQRVALASALIHKPKILILDEPLANIDPLIQYKVKQVFKEFTSLGGAILMSTHMVDTAERLCDRVTLIYRGTDIASGTLDELRRLAEKSDAGLEEVFIALARRYEKHL